MSNKISLYIVKTSPKIHLIYDENDKPYAVAGIRNLNPKLAIKLKFFCEEAIKFLLENKGKKDE